MKYKHEMVFVRILLPFILGIMTCYPIKNFFWLVFFQISCCFLFLVMVLTALMYRAFKAYRFKDSLGIAVHILFFLFGGLCSISNDHSLKPDFYANKTGKYLKLRVNSEPALKSKILSCEAKVISIYSKGIGTAENHASGLLNIAIKLDSLNPIQLTYGSEILIPMKIAIITPITNPGEFDYRAWLAAKNTYFQAFIKQGEVIQLRKGKGNEIIDFALRFRAQQVAYYKAILKDKEAYNVASTLILGYRTDLEEATLDIYSKTGTIHALSVSGMHVGLIYLILNWLLLSMDKNTFLKVLKTTIIITLIWFYALITGFSPSVLRSAIMLSLLIIAKTFSRNSNSFNVLAFSALCLLIYDPYLIWDVGFQLSFLAVIGIIWVQPMILNWWYIKSGWMYKIWSMISLSLAAQLITYPLSIYYFHQFPLYFLVSNLFITLPMTLLMYLGILVLFIKIDVLAAVFEWLIVFTNDGLRWIAGWPFSSLSAIWISKIELILLYAALAFLIVSLSLFRKKTLFTGLSCLLCFYISLTYDKCIAMNQKHIVIFSLKNHYSSAFINGNKAILFSNLKKDDKVFKRSVKPFLEQHKIEKFTIVNGARDTVISRFRITKDTLQFYNYQLDKNELKNCNVSFQQFSL